MKSYNLFIIVIFSFTLFQMMCIISCSTKKDNSDVQTITINLDNSIKEKKLQDVVSSVTMLMLEESEEYPIGVIDKILITDTEIYILDSQRSKSLFVYDRAGKIKNVIHKIGYGKGEYIRPDDFDVQGNTGNLVILDGNQRKLLVYNSQGDFILDYGFKTHISNFIATNNQFILNKGNVISDKSNNHIRIIDIENNPITELLPIPEYSQNITIAPRNSLQQYYNDTVLYLPPLSDKIYQIFGDNLALRYQLNFEKYWPSEKYFEQEKGKHPLKIAQNLMKNGYVAFLNYLEGKDILHINFEYEQEPVSFYYNKHTGNSLIFSISDKNISMPVYIMGTSFVSAVYIEDKNPMLMFYDIDI